MNKKPKKRKKPSNPIAKALGQHKHQVVPNKKRKLLEKEISKVDNGDL